MPTKCTAPTKISITKTVIPSTGGTVTISWSGAKAGTDAPIDHYNFYNKSGSTYTYLFSVALTTTSGSYAFNPKTIGPGLAEGSSWTIVMKTITQAGTGSTSAQYSSDYSTASVSITVNQKPVINQINATLYGTAKNRPYTAWNGFGTISNGMINGTGIFGAGVYVFPYSFTKAGTFTYTFETVLTSLTDGVWNSGGGSPLVWNSKTQRVGGGTPIEEIACSANGAINNLYPPLQTNQAVQWRLKVVLNDGVEDSDPYYIPEGTGKFYRTPGAPHIGTCYNQFSNSNVANTDSALMYQKARLRWTKDDSVSLSNITCSVGSINPSVSYGNIVSEEGDYNYIDVTITDPNLPGDANVVFTVSFINSSGVLNKVLTIDQFKQPKTPVLEEISSVSAFNIYPYTAPSSPYTSVVLNYPFSSSLSDYAVQSGHLKINFGIQSVELNTSYEDYTELVKLIDTSNNTLTVSIDRSKIYSLEENYLYLMSYTGIQPYYVYWTLTNLFGRVFRSPLEDPANMAYFTFTESITGSVSITQSSSYNGTYSSFGDKYVQEGRYLKFDVSYNYYSYNYLTVSPYYKINNGNKVYYQTETIPESHPTETEATLGESYVYKRTVPVGPITTTGSVVFGVEFNADGNISVIETASSINLLKYISPTINLTQFDVGTTDTTTTPVEYNFTVTSNYYDSTVATASYYFRYLTTPSATSSNSYSPGHTTVNIPNSELNWQACPIEVLSVVTFNSDYAFTQTQEAYSAALRAFKMSPTVAYRPNAIGINTTTVASDAIVDIYRTTERDSVYLHGADIDWKITLDSGIINLNNHSTSSSASINLFALPSTADISSLTSQVSTLNSSVATINSDITAINSDITSINSSISSINSDITTISSSISSISTTVSSHTTSINSLTSSVSAINSTIDSTGITLLTIASNKAVFSTVSRIEMNTTNLSRAIEITTNGLRAESGTSEFVIKFNGTDGITLPTRTEITPASAVVTNPSWGNYYTTSTSQPRFYRTGNVVSFDWTAKPTTSTTIGGTAVTICTIPTGFTPAMDAYVTIFGTQNKYSAALAATPGGDLKISYVRDITSGTTSYATISSSDWFRMHMTWITTDTYPT